MDVEGMLELAQQLQCLSDDEIPFDFPFTDAAAAESDPEAPLRLVQMIDHAISPPPAASDTPPAGGSPTACALKARRTSPSAICKPDAARRIRPTIIYSFPPRTIHISPTRFKWLVQSLTGSPETRLRCSQNKPPQEAEPPLTHGDRLLRFRHLHRPHAIRPTASALRTIGSTNNACTASNYHYGSPSLHSHLHARLGECRILPSPPIAGSSFSLSPTIGLASDASDCGDHAGRKSEIWD